ncbi:MAG TPA: tyrosine-type recombinase/integrase [Gemmatimonadota bacterium]|nr:tyrosine-type recombinase/integrase [Gemmatimonadota bacterium]
MSATAFVPTSPFADTLQRFLAGKRAAGYRYRAEAEGLRALDRFLAIHVSTHDPVMTPDIVRQFVARRGQESETTRAHRLTLIRQVCRFLALEDPRTQIPGPRLLGIVRCTFRPRVLTRDEARRFLAACSALPAVHHSPLRGVVLGSALALLLLAGLRAGEALRLTRHDVDLAAAVLRIRDTKFGKTRLVPIASDLASRLLRCRADVERVFGSDRDVPFFPGPLGRPYSLTALRAAFLCVLRLADVPRAAGGRRLRVHDLRHSYVALRMLTWCEQDVDLGTMLPIIATYLGHVGLSSSQRYLQLTPDLLAEVIRWHQRRFGHVIADREAP